MARKKKSRSRKRRSAKQRRAALRNLRKARAALRRGKSKRRGKKSRRRGKKSRRRSKKSRRRSGRRSYTRRSNRAHMLYQRLINKGHSPAYANKVVGRLERMRSGRVKRYFEKEAVQAKSAQSLSNLFSGLASAGKAAKALG